MESLLVRKAADYIIHHHYPEIEAANAGGCFAVVCFLSMPRCVQPQQ
jgi:hypothetical protein